MMTPFNLFVTKRRNLKVVKGKWNVKKGNITTSILFIQVIKANKLHTGRTVKK